MSYRAGEGVGARVRRLLASCGRSAEQITDAYWELLEAEQPGLRGALDALREALAAGARPRELEPDAVALEERLAEAVAAAPARRVELLAVPTELPETALPVWPAAWGVSFAAADYRDREGRSLLERVAKCLGDLDPDVVIEHHEETFRAHAMQIRGAPFAVEIGPTMWSDDVELTVVTAVPRAFPPLYLQRQTALHSVTTAMRLHTDALVGDEDFDDHFLVEASVTAARRLLDEPLRDALLKLAHFTTPRLDVEEGLAKLSFRYVLSPMLVERAIEILTTLRGREVDVRLLR